MKFLRKFNEENNNYYTLIDTHQYDDIIKNTVKFSKYEQKRLNDEFVNWINNNKEVTYNINDETITLNFGGRIFGHEIVINKSIDGWYLLRTIPRDAYTFATRNHRTYQSYYKYYKCDQFEGLLFYLDEKLKKLMKLI